MSEEIQIITPPVADLSDRLDGALVALTEAISMIDSGLISRGLLGGEFGYGADYENDIFLMHPHCGCGKEGKCPWCTGCGVYRESGALASSDVGCKWCADRIGDDRKWKSGWKETQDKPHPDQCPYQTGAGIFARFAPYQHIRGRLYYDPPNFWHKPSNFRVTWYKWIGRDMVTNGLVVDLQQIFSECLASLPKTS